MEVKIISETIQEFLGQQYYLCGRYFQRKGKRLHREVWIQHYDAIPKGYHVHHKDGNTHNNNIENLELLPSYIHLKEHASSDESVKWAKYHMEHNMRPKAIEWHKSEKGRTWHKKHWKHSIGKYINEFETFTCDHCGKLFESNVNHSRFCSNKCKSAYRRKSGIDNETRICSVCQKTFKANKYSKTKTCSKECGSKASGESRKKGNKCEN